MALFFAVSNYICIFAGMKSKALLFKRNIAQVIVIVLCVCVLVSCRNDEKDNPVRTVVINYHCATLGEGQQLLLGNSEYHNSLTQNDIDWRMKKTGGHSRRTEGLGEGFCARVQRSGKSCHCKRRRLCEAEAGDHGCLLIAVPQ